MADPPAGLVQATNGYLYGTTVYGGVGADCSSVYCGTIFKITPTGTVTTLHNFCSDSECMDGESPLAGLVQATNGDLYGTASQGGSNNLCGFGCGTARLGPFCRAIHEKAGRCQEEKQGRDKTCHSFL